MGRRQSIRSRRFELQKLPDERWGGNGLSPVQHLRKCAPEGIAADIDRGCPEKMHGDEAIGHSPDGGGLDEGFGRNLRLREDENPGNGRKKDGEQGGRMAAGAAGQRS